MDGPVTIGGIGTIPKWVVSWNRGSPKSSILDWVFPWKKPSSYGGTPMTHDYWNHQVGTWKDQVTKSIASDALHKTHDGPRVNLPRWSPPRNGYHWLVVWNIFYFPIYWVSNHPNWLSYFFQRGSNHQPGNGYQVFAEPPLRPPWSPMVSSRFSVVQSLEVQSISSCWTGWDVPLWAKEI